MSRNKFIDLYETMIISKWVLEFNGTIHKDQVVDVCLDLYIIENKDKIFELIKNDTFIPEDYKKDLLNIEHTFDNDCGLKFFYKNFLIKKHNKIKKVSSFPYLKILRKNGRKHPTQDDVWIYDPEHSIFKDQNNLITFLRARYDAIVDRTFEVFNSCIFINDYDTEHVKDRWKLVHIKNNEDKYTCRLNIDFLIVDNKKTIGIPFSLIMINEKQINMKYNAHKEESENLYKFTYSTLFFKDDYFLKNRLYKLVNKFDVRLLLE